MNEIPSANENKPRLQNTRRMRRELVPLQVSVPPELKQKLANASEVTRSNMNDIAVAILARKFEVPFLVSGWEGRGISDADLVTFRMPRELRRRINMAAAEQETTASKIVIGTLTDRLLKR